MSKDWLKRARDIKERARILESVPGSGYHDNDRNSVNGLPMAPQKNGKCRLSENPTAFFDERDVHFVGDDAQMVAKLIADYAEDLRKMPMDSLNGSEEQIIRRVAKGRLDIQNVDGAPRLSLWLSEWNDWLYALEECGIGVTGLPAKE